MSTLSLTRVNQKLSQAKVLLQRLDENLSQVEQASLMEATAFHMFCAYQHYLRELAETYGLKNTRYLHTEADLVTAFEASHKHPAEADELVALRRDRESWLVGLQTYYDSLWQIPKRRDSVSQDEPAESGLIALVEIDISADEVLVGPSLLNHWYSAFVALVRRQRETSAEF